MIVLAVGECECTACVHFIATKDQGTRSLDVKSAAGDLPPTSIDDMPNMLMLRCATPNYNPIRNY